MTKAEILDSLIYELKKLDYQNHPAMVESIVSDVYNQLLGQMSQDELDMFEFYAKTYNDQAVTLDTDSNRYYTTLPVAIVNLHRRQGGVLGINSTEGTGHKFFPTSEQEIRMTDNIEAGILGRFYGYFVDHGRIWYDGMTVAIAAAGVRLTLAPQFRDFASTDEINLPTGMDYSLKQLVIDRISNQQVIDLQIEEKD